MSETWLRSNLHSDLIKLEGYSLYRLDRNSHKKRGGGLITYVHQKHASACEPLDDLSITNTNIEAQWLYIHRPQCKDMVTCNIYRPPGGDLSKAITYMEDCLKTLNLGKVEVYLMGDFNVNYQNKKSPEFKKLHFFMQSNGLQQFINSTTRNTDKTKSLIDMALTNAKYIKCAGTLSHFISDHQPIFIVNKKGREARESAEFTGRSYRNYDRETFKNGLKNQDWDTFYQQTDPEKAWGLMLENIIRVLDTLCPLRKSYIKNYRPDWMTNELIEQIKDRDYFYNEAKTRGDQDTWNIAKHLRNVTNLNIRQAKMEFILRELEVHENNSKKFWKVIHKVVPGKKSPAPGKILLKDGSKKLDKCDVAHFINDYFVNVGKVDALNLLYIDPAPPRPGADCNLALDEDLMNLYEVRETDVYKVVRDINVSKSSGLEYVSSFIVKEAFTILIPEVTYMYNLSIVSAQFPNVWKQALVIPIPKTGNLTQVQNYRPISLLPLPGKILEKLIHSQLSNYLEQEELLTGKQHGFRKKHSTIDSIAQFTEYINKKLDSKTPTLATFIDFKKAFDCVQHPVLLKKLAKLNLGNATVKWVESYLSGRKQRVLANGVYSTFQTITQGVPQGSVLGPLFYIIYANDIVDTVKNCKIALYADDTVLYTAQANFADSVSKMQADMEALTTWCNNNGIMANTHKTKVMAFGSPSRLKALPNFEITFNGSPLQQVLSYKYLGVTLDSYLNYNLHASKIIGSVTDKLKQFRKMRSFLDTKAAVLVYKSMMLPVLEYGDVFMSAASATNRKKLQVLQNKGLRCALNKGIETSNFELHAQANILKLKYRREQHVLNFMFDAAQNPKRVKTRLKTGVSTRSQSKRLLKTKRPYTEKFKKSLAYQGPKKWNALSDEFHHVESKNLFKLLVQNSVSERMIAEEGT